MNSAPQFFVQWFPHTVIAKPGVRHYKDVRFRKLSCNFTKHLNRLFMFTAEFNLLAVVLGTICLDILFEMIITMAQWQARPATFDYLEESNGNNILCPRIF